MGSDIPIALISNPSFPVGRRCPTLDSRFRGNDGELAAVGDARESSFPAKVGIQKIIGALSKKSPNYHFQRTGFNRIALPACAGDSDLDTFWALHTRHIFVGQQQHLARRRIRQIKPVHEFEPRCSSFVLTAT
jgi:hypothetical protein